MLSIVVHQLTISSLGPLIFAEIITTLASNCSFWQVIDDQDDYMSGTKKWNRCSKHRKWNKPRNQNLELLRIIIK